LDEQTHRLPRLPRWITQVGLGVLVGLALGFAIGWWLWPVQYTNTSPGALRRDYRDDYVLMVATAYELGDGDVEQAERRLGLLNAQEPPAPLVELTAKLIETGGSSADITRLINLAQALDVASETLTPHVDTQP
jgi:hypothetical protein